MNKERELTLFDLSSAIDQRDMNWLASQSDDVRKEFVPLVAMRWATYVRGGTEAGYMLWLINQRVNHHLFAPGMSQHPDLIFRLLASCGLQGGTLSRTYIKSRQVGNAKLLIDLLAEQHPMATNAELRMLLSLCRRDDIRIAATDSGRSEDQIKDCLKVYDKLN